MLYARHSTISNDIQKQDRPFNLFVFNNYVHKCTAMEILLVILNRSFGELNKFIC